MCWSQTSLACDRCHGPAGRVWEATRVAIDIDLEQPVLLAVTVSGHPCRACRHYCRAQPPFLRRAASYTERVVRKAVQAVYEDGRAMRRVARRLARDLWVRPSEKMVRLWCQAHAAGLDCAGDYQPWVGESFSGVLGGDEVYQGQLALLLAVDPAGPAGDRLVGYQLVHGSVDQASVAAFLGDLKTAGIVPDQVITDGAAPYPRVLAAVWPTAAHQLCLFHETRRVTAAVDAVTQAVRKTLPKPPPAPPLTRGGRRRTTAPPAAATAAASERWRQRVTTRQAATARAGELRAAGRSWSAIARQLGLTRRTVRAWRQRAGPSATVAPAAATAGPASARQQRRRPGVTRRVGIARVHELHGAGWSVSAIARDLGVTRNTVRAWRRCAVPSPPAAPPDPPAPTAPPRVAEPPAPGERWDQVRQARQALRAGRFLLLRRPDHLTAEPRAQLQALLDSPVGADLRVARAFLEDWYGLWRDAQGQRRSVVDAQARYQAWQANAAAARLAPLRRVQQQIDPARFTRLSTFLAAPTREATNNGAERLGRTFRHASAPPFTLRTPTAIDGLLKVMAARKHDAATTRGAVHANRSPRGRTPRTRTTRLAA
ncbi:MAG TPA: helix-turn-helix domain-containing protein [Streptosporangiaceae bacterium]